MNYLLLNYTHMAYLTDALEVLLSYLQAGWQRVKINTIFSSWTQLL